MINNNLLIPKRVIFNVLGCLCKNPSLMFEDKYKIQVKDFGSELYKILYGAINNLTIGNVKIKEITAVDIDNYLAGQVRLYKKYESENGFDFILSCIENCNEDLFEKNYDMLKKMSLLRDFNNQGFDISFIYNPESSDLAMQTEQMKNIEKMSMQDIIDRFNLKLLSLKNDWNLEGNHKSYDISDGLDTLLEELHTEPDYGYPFLNGYYNTIFRGMRMGKYMIRSASTGVGKSRMALKDIVSVSASHIFDLDTMSWKENGNVYASCFISTELDKQELQTCLISIISGVSETVVKQGRFTQNIYDRVHRAIEILKQAPIKLHYIEDFSIGDIEQIIEKDIIESNVKFVWFDYLMITPKLSRTIQEEFGLGLREDQILLNFSTRLKNIAVRYNIFLATATQLNRTSSDRALRDSSAIRGGNAQIDKADHAIQMYKVQEEDLKKIKPFIDRGFEQPNFQHVIYKNRSGINNLIIWSQLDQSNMHEKVLFVTTGDYQPVNIQPSYFQFIA